jgi:cold shock CspA family protein
MKAQTVTTAVAELIPPNAAQGFVAIQPIGGDIFIKIDGSKVALTAANGIKVADGQLLVLANDAGGGDVFIHGVEAISAGSVDVRVQGVD